TTALSDKLEDPDLDYDPLIQAQDCDRETLKTLEIKPETGRENVYSVCYAWSNDKKICIRLLLTEENGYYLIDDILSDANIHGNE
ncbi:MAG: YbjP/YqhG family protein, partial [Bacteroidales bacterium]|nr:YbjP/YqhG family protein [Bacteroidales bacterium]